MQVIAVRIDIEGNYTYSIADRLASHRKPYVGVSRNNRRVAWIALPSGEVNFYKITPKEVERDKAILEDWVTRNLPLAIRKWRESHPEIPV